jgi:hypothetical protein
MDVSLNEVEAMAKRAARGAGHEWGTSEEAGRATRWLCAHGLPGVAALAALLPGIAAAPAHAPRALGPHWQAGKAPLCPLLTGACLSDQASVLVRAPVTLAQVAHPLLLLPFLHGAARQTGETFAVTWPGFAATLSPDGPALAETGGTSNPRADTVTIAVAPGAPSAPPLPRATRADVADTDWTTLDRLAGRTYAPATEASRRLGAGAGLSDND